MPNERQLPPPAPLWLMRLFVIIHQLNSRN